MGRVADDGARRVVLAVAIVAALVGLLQQAVVDGVTGIGWGAAAALFAALCLGPAGAVLVAVVTGAAGLLLGLPGDRLAVELLGIVLMLPASLLLERRAAARGRGRGTLVVLEFVGMAGVMVPLVLAGTAELLTELDPLAEGARVSIAAVALVPGARVLAHGVPVRRPRPRAFGVAAAVVAAAALALGVGGAEVAGSAVAVTVAIPVVVVVAAAGYGAFAVLNGASAALLGLLLPLASLLGLGTGGNTGTGRIAGTVLLALGFVVATEYDRLRDLDARFEALFSPGGTPAAAATLPDLVIDRVSPGFADLVGVTGDDAFGRPLREFVRVVDPELLEHFVIEQAPSVTVGVELAGPRARAGRMSVLRAHRDDPLPDLAVVQLTDVTDLVERAEALDRANAALADFADRATHDLKQPLAAVAGYAESLVLHIDEISPELMRTMAGRLEAGARQAAERLDRMVADAKDAGQGSRAISISDVLDAIEPVVPLGETVTLRRRLDTDLVTTRPGMLLTVLGNLVANSVQYREGGGGTVTVGSRRFATGTAVTVTDDGVGIPVDRLGDVFQHGVRLLEVDAPGTGRGLADAMEAAAEAGATLRALPSAEGARFELWVPGAGGAEAPLTVLVALDDPGQRVLVHTVLRLDDRVHDVGEVVRVADLQAAVRHTRPDVLLVDHGVVAGEALAVLPDVLHETPRLRLIVSSGGRGGAGDVLDQLAAVARQRGAAAPLVAGDLDTELLELLREVRGTTS